MLKVAHQATAPSAGAQVLWQVPRAVAALRKAEQHAQQILSAGPIGVSFARVRASDLAFKHLQSKNGIFTHSYEGKVRSFEKQYSQAVCEEEACRSLVQTEMFPFAYVLKTSNHP